MKHVKTIAMRTLWLLAGLYLSVAVLLKIPAIQGYIGSAISNMMADKLGTKVEIGKVGIGLFNRIVIDNVTIYDRTGKQMLHTSRLAVKTDLLPLIHNKISISSAQVFGMNASLYRQSADMQPNFKFLIDAFSPIDTTSHTPLDLRIMSLVMRNGTVRYDQYDKPRTPGKFDTFHLDIRDISSHIKLYALTDDSLSIYVKKLSFKESSGLKVEKLSFCAEADKKKTGISNFLLQLPETNLSIANASMEYRIKNGSIDMRAVRFHIKMNRSTVTPNDLGCFADDLKSCNEKMSLFASLSGTRNSITINSLDIHSANNKIGITGNGNIRGLDHTPRWDAHIKDFRMNNDGIQFLIRKISDDKMPIKDAITNMETIRFQGDLSGRNDFLACHGNIQTGIGNAKLDVSLNGNHFNGEISTNGINMQCLLNDNKFGSISANIKANGNIARNKKPVPFEEITSKVTIESIDYNSYCYRNISIDGTYKAKTFNAIMSIDDPNGKAYINGSLDMTDIPVARFTAETRNFNPSALRLTDATGNKIFNFLMKADISGKSTKTIKGNIEIEDFEIYDGKNINRLNNLSINSGNEGDGHFINIQSDFGYAEIKGKYDYKSIAQSLANIIGSKIPTLSGLSKATSGRDNNFDLVIHLNDSEWLMNFFNIPLELYGPLELNGSIDDRLYYADMTLDIPGFSYGGNKFNNTHAQITTQNDTLRAIVRTDKTDNGEHGLSVDLDIRAADDKLAANIMWDLQEGTPLHGTLNTEADFHNTFNGKTAARVTINKSEMTIDRTDLEIQPSEIIYSDNALVINNFKISNNSQYLTINGTVTKNENDSLTVDMHNIDVGYVLDLINFHSVKFSGYASGRSTIKSLFSTPDARADIRVEKFRFENGRMGTLYANVAYDTNDKQININAVADDGSDAQTVISGYVSPERNYIDLGIEANGTRLEFLENFCGSFMGNVNARGNGHCRVFGDLKYINLEGKMVADGKFDIKPLNTTYTLRHDTITMVPDEIVFKNDTIYDIYGHGGIVNGALHHKNLTKLTFDIDVEAKNLLTYDFHDYNGNTFYGTVFATGNCYIKGRPGEVTMDIDATPEKGSFIEYNAANHDGISDTEFIRWRDATQYAKPQPDEESRNTVAENETTNNGQSGKQTPNAIFREISSDVKLNLLINTTSDFTLRILMDQQTGDYIALNGTGIIRASYFNKGTFEMFGNYLVEDGVYKLTIQNIIKKEFRFQQGSSIAFGGDPFGASINLKGIYTINAVSLSELQIGRSFTTNNIRVNCLMNITGTAGQPNVTFDLDLPTLSTDAQQMIRSVINSEEDMNQQVLYLLAIGRFYNQGNNNASQEDASAQSQTSLAMQSLLSGTISQQINTVLSNVVKSNSWNFGANISTGDEGWNNAEYEGLLSGRLLDNRLLINGQFGYRDNVNTADGSNFIGDFDIRYILFPNGNLAIKVYNQSNDRYFTRNSLTTQGVGIIMKKDFKRLGDIFQKRKKIKNTKTKKQ